MAETLLSPTLLPESPETVELVDDQTVTFLPQFGRLWAQRNSFADPRWRIKRTYKAMRAADSAELFAALQGAQGAFNSVRATPTYARRGSFACPELITNNDFSQGTTGWSAGGDAALSASNGALRITRSGAIGGAGNAIAYQTPSPILYAPYCWRVMVSANPFSQNVGPTVGSGVQFLLASTYDTGTATVLRTTPVVPYSAGGAYYLDNLTQSGSKAGDYVEVPWCSLARCALADNAPNIMLWSDQPDNAAWSKTNITVSATTDVAPDGTADARRLSESAVNSNHTLTQTGVRANVAADLVVYGYFKRVALSRDIRLVVGNDVSTNYSWCIFDLLAGTAGTVSNTGTSTNARAFIAYAGNNWWFCALVARAVAAATIGVEYDMASGGLVTYLGTTGSQDWWRLGAAVSSVPTRGGETTSAALASGTAQSGNILNLKGLPLSTNGLLQAGDFFEVNGELKQCVVPLNSDAAGLGTILFRPGLHVAAADNDAVIVSNPMGRFMLTGGVSWDALFGGYVDATVTLEEVGA